MDEGVGVRRDEDKAGDDAVAGDAGGAAVGGGAASMNGQAGSPARAGLRVTSATTGVPSRAGGGGPGIGTGGVADTARPGADTGALRGVGPADPGRLDVAHVDVTDAGQVAAFLASLGGRRFDVIFLNVGIYGPLHQSVLEATPEQVTEVVKINAIGPVRLARSLRGHLAPRRTFAFMSSHRASIAGNVEGGLELYRASKAALNMLTRGLYADVRAGGHTD